MTDDKATREEFLTQIDYYRELISELGRLLRQIERAEPAHTRAGYVCRIALKTIRGEREQPYCRHWDKVYERK